MDGESCSSANCHWFSRQQLVLVPVDVLVLYGLHHCIRHDVEATGRHVTLLPIVVKLTFALRTVKFVKCQSLFKIYKHVNVL